MSEGATWVEEVVIVQRVMHGFEVMAPGKILKVISYCRLFHTQQMKLHGYLQFRKATNHGCSMRVSDFSIRVFDTILDRNCYGYGLLSPPLMNVSLHDL